MIGEVAFALHAFTARQLALYGGDVLHTAQQLSGWTTLPASQRRAYEQGAAELIGSALGSEQDGQPCSTCGGPTMTEPGETFSLHAASQARQRQLVTENARLRTQIERLCGMVESGVSAQLAAVYLCDHRALKAQAARSAEATARADAFEAAYLNVHALAEGAARRGDEIDRFLYNDAVTLVRGYLAQVRALPAQGRDDP